MQHAADGQASDELWNQTVAHKVFGLHLREGFSMTMRAGFDVCMKAHRLVTHTPFNNLLKSDERAAADEENVGRVNGEELLMRMLAPALRRNVCYSAFQNFQERLLHAFARHVARDRRVLVLAANLVNLVNVDDALLRALNVAVSGLQEFQDDVLNVFANVARLGQGSCVNDCEGN